MNALETLGVINWDWAGTVIVTVTVAVVGAILGVIVTSVGWALKTAIGSLLTALATARADIELLDAKLGRVIEIVEDVPKLKKDMNEHFKRLRELKQELDASKSTDAR